MTDLDQRVGVVERDVAVLEKEMEDRKTEERHTRERLHQLEAVSTIVQVMVQQIAEIRLDVKSLLGTQAGESAVTRWKWSAAALGVALAGVLVALIYHH